MDILSIDSMSCCRGTGNPQSLSRPEATCETRTLTVGGRLPAVPARCFAKLRSDKNQTKHSGSRFRAGSLQSICRVLVAARASRVARSTEARTQELRRLCPFFADRAQEGDKQTGLGRTW
jgi:hypothetical protein